jgi:hypothetical protein
MVTQFGGQIVRRFGHGDLRIAVLTVHNSWGPAVPEFHESALARNSPAPGSPVLGCFCFLNVTRSCYCSFVLIVSAPLS